MADIGVQPIRMRDADLRIEADSYRASVNDVRLVPQADVEWDSPECSVDYFPYMGRRRWWLQLGFIQDLSTPGSLSTYLLEHAGQQKVMTLAVQGKVAAVTALIVPATIGGVVNQIPVAAVALPLYGPPDITPEAA